MAWLREELSCPITRSPGRERQGAAGQPGAGPGRPPSPPVIVLRQATCAALHASCGPQVSGPREERPTGCRGVSVFPRRSSGGKQTGPGGPARPGPGRGGDGCSRRGAPPSRCQGALHRSRGLGQPRREPWAFGDLVRSPQGAGQAALHAAPRPGCSGRRPRLQSARFAASPSHPPKAGAETRR